MHVRGSARPQLPRSVRHPAMSLCRVGSRRYRLGMTEEDAHQIAISLLGAKLPEFAAGDWVLSGVEESDSAWAFSYNTREYVELNRPGMSGDSKPWEGWSHVWEHVEEVPA